MREEVLTQNDAACMLAARRNLLAALSIHLFVYRRATLNELAQLELCTFEGKATHVSNASAAAAAGALRVFLGLGYAWALVDDRNGMA